jgi:hypothetical protein
LSIGITFKEFKFFISDIASFFPFSSKLLMI